MEIKKLKQVEKLSLKQQQAFWAKYLEEGKKNERRKIQRKIRRK